MALLAEHRGLPPSETQQGVSGQAHEELQQLPLETSQGVSGQAHEELQQLRGASAPSSLPLAWGELRLPIAYRPRKNPHGLEQQCQEVMPPPLLGVPPPLLGQMEVAPEHLQAQPGQMDVVAPELLQTPSGQMDIVAPELLQTASGQMEILAPELLQNPSRQMMEIVAPELLQTQSRKMEMQLQVLQMACQTHQIEPPRWPSSAELHDLEGCLQET